uniref:Uncharacterized protein LOC100369241 n=1 Tax=Saccoglossus kowalevskii TaxID=10224 RepID=A0ABM0GWM8_SACKO|nr:PREDICTED: uncharacterized protein LOC100369241 [Saccoglossus kowalevskii]
MFADQYPCPGGTYNNFTGQVSDASCELCPPGLFCESSGLSYPSGLCDEGYYCKGGSDMYRPFDIGFAAPLPTPTSYVYPNDTCHPLYDCVCPDFSLSVGGLCPSGYYCPTGSDEPEPCIPGMYCQTAGLAFPTGYCYAGYYCNHTSDTPDQHDCPPGHYCPVGTDIPFPCPSGTYTGSYLNIDVIDCVNCTAGKYCEAIASPYDLLCPPGHYCPIGSWEPLLCPNGTFQPQSGQSECGECPAGFFCDPTNGTAAVPCPQGYYCPPGTAIGEAKPCPAGSYGDGTYLWNVDNCTDCTAGFYCETPALTTPTDECFAGYYCTGGAASPTPAGHLVDYTDNSTFTGNDICPRGYYCMNGTAYPEPCPIGTFSINTKVTQAEDCEECRPGHYCNLQGFVRVDDAPLCDAGYLLEAHARELEELEDRLDSERARQQLALRDKLLERKKRMLADQKRKQEVEMAQELLAQKKELADVRSKLVKDAEHKAITEGIQEQGTENTETVVKAVLDKRHAQEMSDLDAQFAAERQVAVEAKLAKLHDKYDAERDKMLHRHDEEMNKLLQQNLTPEQMQQKKAELLNKQQIELAELEKRLAEERRHQEQEALQDWELRYARAKLDLKEKHYQEYAEALRKFLSDKSNVSAEEAMKAAQQLEDVKRRLERERKENEDRLKRESEEFERREKRKFDESISAYEKQLDAESRKEKERTERSVAALNKRKEELLQEKQQKMKEQLENLKGQGATQEEQDRIMEEHQKDIAKLTNKMDADRLRMQSGLQERLRKKREEKIKSQQSKSKEEMSENMKEHKEKRHMEESRIKTNEILTLREMVDLDHFGHQVSEMPQSAPYREPAVDTSALTEQSGEMPSSYTMAAPLSDAEITALLMASPLYKKLEEIKELMSKGVKPPKAVSDGDHFLDNRDAQWGNDGKLVPVDLNKLSGRNLVVYKFGCFVIELLAVHCQHKPVTLLLAEKIPANEEISANAYRNSYHYDHSNRILYMRLARLDFVGEFLLVLAHSLAHIHTGDMRDDTQPEFSREFHKSLSVLCHDLFFARYRRSSSLLSLKSASKAEQSKEEQDSRMMLEMLFGDSHLDADQRNMVDELMDVKLLRDTNNEGVHFDKDNMDERLTKYSKFTVNSQLRGFLGRSEDKIGLARQHGMSDKVDERLKELTGTAPATRVLPKHSTKSPLLAKLPAELSGTALWQKATQDALAKESKTGKSTGSTETETEELQDTVDQLTADFSNHSSKLIETKDKVNNLQQQLHSQSESMNSGTLSPDARTKQASLVKETTKRLLEAQEDVVALTMKKDKTLDRLKQAENDLEKKQDQLKNKK